MSGTWFEVGDLVIVKGQPKVMRLGLVTQVYKYPTGAGIPGNVLYDVKLPARGAAPFYTTDLTEPTREQIEEHHPSWREFLASERDWAAKQAAQRATGKGEV